MTAAWTQERIDGAFDRHWTVEPAVLLHNVEELARSVQAGGADWDTVADLVFAMRTLRARDTRHPNGSRQAIQERYGIYLRRNAGPHVDFTPNPRYDNDAAISAARWIDGDGYGFASASAGQIRAVWPATGRHSTEECMDFDTMRTLPGVLPEDDAAPVLVYELRLHVAQLLNGIGRGEDIGGRVAQLIDRQVKGTLYPSEDPLAYRD